MDIGAAIMVVVLVVVMPVGVLMSFAGVAGALGALLGRNSDLNNLSAEGQPNEHHALAHQNP